jgi:hypothetical protein
LSSRQVAQKQDIRQASCGLISKAAGEVGRLFQAGLASIFRKFLASSPWLELDFA